MKNGKKENNKNKTNKNKKNNLPKVFHSEILEQDTNIIIKYILFNKELHDSINISKISPFYKRYSNCYLTNITLSLQAVQTGPVPLRKKSKRAIHPHRTNSSALPPKLKDI